MPRKICIALIALTLAGCDDVPSGPLGSGIVPDAAFHAQARAALSAFQSVSFSDDIEVCGYFGFDADGAFLSSPPARGDNDSCLAEDIPDEMIEIVASYHTQSSFDTDADSEVPSTDDLLADMDEEVFGYIATPGGRFWLVDWRAAKATQICGLYCLPSDEDFIEGDAGPIAQSYTLDELQAREDG